jgi:hypothetical protein
MTSGAKQMLIGSMAVAGVVILLSIVDLVSTSPFGGQPMLDAMFLISGGIICYMCFDTYKEMS